MKYEPRIPQQERSIEKKELIIAAGLKLFSEKGYYNTNTKEIALAAGVSTGTFYAYFIDKRTLFIEVFNRYNGKIRETLQAVSIDNYIDSGRERDFILHLIETLLQAHNISPEFHQEIEAMVYSDDEVGLIMDLIQKQAIEITSVMLGRWGRRIRPDNIMAASIIVQRTIENMVHTIKFSRIEVSPDILKEEIVDMIYHYLF